MFDRLYQENWLEQVTTKKGQSNWSIASLCSELVAKMAKDIGMTIRKGIVVPFLPCLVAFWGFHPYMFFHFFLLLIHTLSTVTYVVTGAGYSLTEYIYYLQLNTYLILQGPQKDQIAVYPSPQPHRKLKEYCCYYSCSADDSIGTII